MCSAIALEALSGCGRGYAGRWPRAPGSAPFAARRRKAGPGRSSPLPPAPLEVGSRSPGVAAGSPLAQGRGADRLQRGPGPGSRPSPTPAPLSPQLLVWCLTPRMNDPEEKEKEEHYGDHVLRDPTSQCCSGLRTRAWRANMTKSIEKDKAQAKGLGIPGGQGAGNAPGHNAASRAANPNAPRTDWLLARLCSPWQGGGASTHFPRPQHRPHSSY